MPTERARLTITETGDVAAMLEEAGERWPADRAHPARLLKRLAERGAEVIRADKADEQRAWRATVTDVADAAGPEAFPPATSTSCATTGRRDRPRRQCAHRPARPH